MYVYINTFSIINFITFIINLSSWTKIIYMFVHLLLILIINDLRSWYDFNKVSNKSNLRMLLKDPTFYK